MRILVIGGSVFLGRAFVEQALARGDEVTTFNRGRSGADLPGVEAVRGDREVPADLERLVAGRSWDAVIDMAAQLPRVAGASARALSGHAETYLFISSVHAYADWPAQQVDEGSPRHACAPDAGVDDVPGNPLKAGCERAVEEGFHGRVLIVNPGLITGPYENIGRLPWWLERIARGGPVLAPGDPGRAMQLIDARDIADFGLRQLSAGASGRYLASGVPGNTTFGGLLQECIAVTGSDAEPVWVSDGFLLGHEVEPWTELPLWAPAGPEMDGVWLASSVKALGAGLHSRPVAETVRDTWAWICSRGPAARPYMQGSTPLGIEPGKERRLLKEWAGSAEV